MGQSISSRIVINKMNSGVDLSNIKNITDNVTSYDVYLTVGRNLEKKYEVSKDFIKQKYVLEILYPYSTVEYLDLDHTKQLNYVEPINSILLKGNTYNIDNIEYSSISKKENDQKYRLHKKIDEKEYTLVIEKTSNPNPNPNEFVTMVEDTILIKMK